LIFFQVKDRGPYGTAYAATGQNNAHADILPVCHDPIDHLKNETKKEKRRRRKYLSIKLTGASKQEATR
jgi:hypothetical protein